MGTVRGELAFPLENRGESAVGVARGVEEVALALGIEALLDRATTTLSGGELQRVALGAALAGRPRLLVLDEPTSQLDPVAGDELLALLRRLNEEWGTAILLAEHRLERCLGAADRVIALHGGALACDADPVSFLAWAHDAAPALETPGAALIAGLGLRPPPAAVKQARATLRAAGLLPDPPERAGAHAPASQAQRSRRCACAVSGTSSPAGARSSPGSRSRSRPASASPCSAATAPASPRSCATRPACSSPRAVASSAPVASRCCCRTPATTSSRTASAPSWARARSSARASTALADRHPRDLSAGERQRLALAIVTDGPAQPAVLCLDEPTRGMDRTAKATLAAELLRARGRGRGDPRRDPRPRVRRRRRDPRDPPRRRADHRRRRRAGAAQRRLVLRDRDRPDPRRAPRHPDRRAGRPRADRGAGAAVSWQLASFALLGLALAAGFAWYERSKPSSRTVALVATLAALATLGRIAFAPLPNVKPTTDIVLIAGYVLGGAPGFTVGAVSAIASNVVFSEGPWTPWQMLAWGLVGVAGWLLSLRGGPRRRIAMAIACGLAGFGYGFVVDLYTWLGYSQHTFGQYLAVESASFPFNLAHAAGNVVFYLAFGPALVRALRRFRERLHGHAGSRRGRRRRSCSRGCSRSASPCPCGSAGTARAAARAGPLSYLVATQRADGGWGLGPGEPSSAESTGWVVIGLAAAHAPAARDRPRSRVDSHATRARYRRPAISSGRSWRSRRRGRRWGTSSQRLDRRREADGSFDGQANWTAFAILAQRAAGAPIDDERAWLERQQNADGGFGFAQRGDPSDIDDTAGAIEALVAAGAPVGACDALPPARRERRRRLPARAGRGLERAVDRVGGAGAAWPPARPPRGRCAGSRRASPPPARSTTRRGMRRRRCG